MHIYQTCIKEGKSLASQIVRFICLVYLFMGEGYSKYFIGLVEGLELRIFVANRYQG